MKSASSRTYILPTGYGLSFAIVCLFLLAVAFASSNNAIYLLCFVMSSLGIQSLVLTNKNTENVEINALEIPDFHADESGFAIVTVHNASIEDAHSLRCEFALKTMKNSWTMLPHLKPGERARLRIPVEQKHSGRYAIPKLKLSSDFPFYLSRSWKMHAAQTNYYVYPPRKGVKAFSQKAYALQQKDEIIQDEFKGHRDYRENDSPRSIDWKVSSRLQKTTVKEYETEGTKKVMLRWQDVEATGDADKKAQLSLWIDLAEKNEYQYGLVLPHLDIELGSGAKHKSQCLRALV